MQFVPRGPQYEGIEFMMQKAFGALLWDPGVGKTGTSLMSYKLLRDAGIVRRALVAASVNIIHDVWPEEIEKFDDFDMTYAIVHGSEKRRLEHMDLDADVYLTNYENIEWFQQTFRKKHGIDMLLIDESSKFRNLGTNRFRSLRKLLDTFKRRYILTGTPIPKGYLNLWPQFYIVDMGQSLGLTMQAYKNMFFRPGGFKGYKWELRGRTDPHTGEHDAVRLRTMDEIMQAIAPRSHRAERQNKVGIKFIDLPIKLPNKAMHFYRELEKEFIAQWRGKTLLASNAAVATNKLRQAANGSVYYDRAARSRDKGKFVVVHDRKVARLAELADDLRVRGQSLLTAYEFDHDHEGMTRMGLDVPSYSRARRGHERTQLKEAWNRKELHHLTGQISSMSMGLNVQYGGWNGAYFGMTYNLEDYEQFYQRLWRSDQEHEVHMYRLWAEGTIEEVEIEVLHQRGADQMALLGGIGDLQRDVFAGVKKHYGLR